MTDLTGIIAYSWQMRPGLRNAAIAFLQTALRLLIILIANYTAVQDALRAPASFELEHGGNLFRLC